MKLNGQWFFTLMDITFSLYFPPKVSARGLLGRQPKILQEKFLKRCDTARSDDTFTLLMLSISRTTDAQCSLFSLKYRSFGLGQTNWADKFWGMWGIFGRTISIYFSTVSPLSMFFHYSTTISTKNKLLYPHAKQLFGIRI